MGIFPMSRISANVHHRDLGIIIVMADVRLKRFDALKFFGIFLVVWGHSIAWFTTDTADEMLSFRIIYSFHMPLFMAIAGFFSAGLVNKRFSDILIGRCIPLLIPTFTVGVALSLLEWLTVGADFWDMLALSFWFLVSLALCTALFRLTVGIKRHRTLMLFLGLLISQIICPFLKYDFNIGMMYPSFLLGVLLSWNYDYLKRRCLPIFIVSLVSYSILIILQSDTGTSLYFDPGHGMASIVKFAVNYVMNMAIGLLGATAAISMFEFLARFLPSGNFGNRICAMGKDTLAIYILSGVLLHAIIARFIKLDFMNSIVYQYVATPIIAWLTIEVCVVLARLMRLSPMLSLFIFGKKSVKNIEKEGITG